MSERKCVVCGTSLDGMACNRKVCASQDCRKKEKNERGRRWRDNHHEQLLDAKRRYYQASRERILKAQYEHAQEIRMMRGRKCVVCGVSIDALYGQRKICNNPECFKINRSNRYKANLGNCRDNARERVRRWNQENKEKRRLWWTTNRKKKVGKCAACGRSLEGLCPNRKFCKEEECRKSVERAKSRRYRLANLEAVRKMVRDAERRRREANPEAAKARAQRYRDANPEKYRDTQRRWCKNNPNKIRAKWQRTRQKLRELELLALQLMTQELLT